MHSLASPFCQGIFFLVAGLYLVWEAWVGWRRGVVRSAMYFVAVVLSVFVGYAVGQGVYTVCGKLYPGPAFLVALAAGAGATVLILLLCILLSALLFKRTSQQPSSIVRLFFGAGGAFFGLLTGLAILWGAISLIRVAGTMAESSMVGRPQAEPHGSPRPAASAAVRPQAEPRSSLRPAAPAAARPQAEPSGAMRSIAILKESIELGSAGQLVESVDILPPQVYKMIEQVGKLRADPSAMTRLLDYPGVQEIIQNPRIVRLLEDPATARAVQKNSITDLMTSKAILDAANDPELAKLFKNFDLQKALDYAVPSADASPTPKKKKP